MKSNAFKMVISFSALTFFILISTASFFVELFNSNIGDDKFFDRKSEYLGNDVYKETVEVTINNEIQERSVITGKKNSKGIWDGPYRRDDYDYSISAKHIVEEGVMVNGVRHGKWNYIDKGLETRCYDMGKLVSCGEKSAIILNKINAFEILEDTYFWYLFILNGSGFENDMIQSFIDRIESGLAEYDFDVTDFDTYYDWTLDDIEEDAGEHEEIFRMNAFHSMLGGLEELKFFELRLAVIDHYRSPESATYEIVKKEYPAFIDRFLSYEEVKATEKEFELFCNDLDARMGNQSPLDKDDPFFVDSIDVRMFRAFYEIMSEIEFSSSLSMRIKAASLLSKAESIRQKELAVFELLKQISMQENPQNAALVVANLMGQQYAKGDIIRQCVKEAWLAGKENGLAVTLTTLFVSHLSATSVVISGNMVNDGEEDILSRGIVWSANNHPTLNDSFVQDKGEDESFMGTLSGLIPGVTYYARAFASGRAGIAYGNVIEFTAGSDNGTNPGTGSEPFIAHSYFPWLTSGKYVMFRQLPDGGYIAAGYGATTFSDIFIARYNENGDTLWTRRHAPPAGSVSRYPIAGDITSGGFYLLTNNSKPQIQWNEVMYFNFNGDSVWSTPVSEILQWSGLPFNSICATPGGGSVIAGGSNGFPSAATIKKLGKNGEIEWAIDSFTNDYGYNWFYDVDVNADGEVFATGRVQNNINGRESFLVAKVSNTGVRLWDKVYYSGLASSGDSIIGTGQSVTATNNGGCIAGGYATAPGKAGRVVMKRLDNAGNTSWDNKYHRFAEDGSWSKSQVYDIVPFTGGNYLALIHQYDGSSDPKTTLMKFTPQGDTLWTQYGVDRRWRISGTDNRNNILLCGNSPLAQAGWWEHATIVRATPGGIIYSPVCTLPYDKSVNIAGSPVFEWTVPNHKGTFKVQLSSDSTFNQIAFEQSGITRNTWTSPRLNSMTSYFWRVNITGAEGGPSAWSKPFRFTVKDLTGIHNADFVQSLMIFPNPVAGMATISFNLQSDRDITIKIINQRGQTILNDRLIGNLPGENRQIIDLSGYPNGIYLCRISDGKQIVVKKLVVAH
jgi:hypothetical protein